MTDSPDFGTRLAVLEAKVRLISASLKGTIVIVVSAIIAYLLGKL